MTQLPGRPVLLELDEETWNDYLDRVEKWLDNVLMIQSAFRQLAEDTRDRIEEYHTREFLTEVAETAKKHEQQVEELYRLIGRDPSAVRKLGGTVMAKMREGLGNVMGLAGGAVGSWTDLHQLFLSSLNAISAVGAAEQLGLALGLREFAALAFQIGNEKFTHHRLLQEISLEMAPLSILYRKSI